jgi:UDP-3-O-[3-hydroxymyristoyl] glucosamine N-acyltransferase
LRTPNPYLAFARVLEWFYPPYTPPVGIHPTAVIAPTARVGASAYIGPYAVIDEHVVIGDHARIFAHVVIYPNVQIGHEFTAHAGVVVREGTKIGDRVVLQAGVVIGGDGFGYVPLPDGSAYKIPQTGTVSLADDVEIGANTTIDRAAMGATVIRRGAKLDNLVMIGHGCDIGEGALLAAQVGLSGSTKLEAGVRMGGQVGAAGHLTVGKNTMVAAQSGIPHDVPANSVIGGYPAVDIQSWRRYSAALPKLPELMRRIRRLEQALRVNEE